MYIAVETWPESEYIGTLPQYQVYIILKYKLCSIDLLLPFLQYLTEKLSEYWKKWVNFSQEAMGTIASGGYYSVKILSNLRLISFNSNYGWVVDQLYDSS